MKFFILSNKLIKHSLTVEKVKKFDVFVNCIGSQIKYGRDKIQFKISTGQKVFVCVCSKVKGKPLLFNPCFVLCISVAEIHAKIYQVCHYRTPIVQLRWKLEGQIVTLLGEL